MQREQALELLHNYVSNPRMIAHCLASEAVMRALAVRLNEDPELWGLTGLLHDLDVELTEGDMNCHAMETAKILRELGMEEQMVEAIMLHNENAAHQQSRSKKLHYALAAGETITGLIMATALVYPDKKLENVQAKSVVKRMKEKAFAASVKRETIMECEKIGLSLNDFTELSVTAMKGVAAKIGL
ncbi:MAG TPA: HDIG domain-containing protein [Bacteroidales bacterium]|nr:HDIG domain-containing protein [Bacteroidales bacterium]